MKIKVEGKGVLQGITDIIKGLSGLVDKVFKNFDDGDSGKDTVKVDTKSKRTVSVSEGEGQGIEMDLIVFEEKIGTVIVIPQKDGLYTLVFKTKGQSPDKVENIKEADMDKAKAEWSLKYFAKRQGGAKSSKNLSVTLQRVNAGKQDEIRLTAIRANYNIKAAMESLDAVLEDESVLDMITEEPITFDIMDSEEDGFMECEVAGEVLETTNEVEVLLAAAVTFSNNLLMMHWNVKGLNFNTLHNELNDWYHASRWDIDTLGELAVELCNSAPNPGLINIQDNLLPSRTQYTEEEAYQIINEQIFIYVLALETYYVNFAHDVQSALDNMIRYWRKEQNYKVARTLKG